MLTRFSFNYRSFFWLIAAIFLPVLVSTGCTTANTPLKHNFSASQSQISSSSSTQAEYFQKLQEQPYIEHGSRKIKAVALTFDADMTPYMLKELQTGKVKTLYDERIVKTLKDDKVPATIFMTGMWAETYPEAAKMLAQDPQFEIENHSYDHAAFHVPCYTLGLTQNAQQNVVKAQEVLKKIAGVEPHYFRFPGGCFDDDSLALVHSFGLIPVQWDVISGDAFLKKAQGIIQQVVTQAKPGSIIVFHLNGAPNAPATAEALPKIIQELKTEGYAFMTLDQLMQSSLKT